MSLATLIVALAAATASAAPATEPVLLDFHAEWCGPCREMRPAVAQLRSKGYRIKSIDIDRHPELAEKYRVQAVPTFIVVDGEGNELNRTKGSQPAAQLAKMYIAARANMQPPAGNDAGRGEEEQGEDEPASPARARAALVSNQTDGGDAEEDPRARPESEEEADRAAAFKNPKPWETVVRIRVEGNGSIGFGSGTIIHSTSEEAIILTCAHIFKLDGPRQARPEQFPRPIYIDLFDGKLHGQNPQTVHQVERVPGKAMDYDFDLDVGLIRIRPGHKLPASRVVPKHWSPRERFGMLAVGCPGGQDASPMTTMIVNPQIRGLSGHKAYEAIECSKAPEQGRSGGGLYTTDGYVAGVCNFAEPKGNVGLYATPNSIYSILDRNRLMALYAPVDARGGAMLASRTGTPRSRSNSDAITMRGQSPDSRDELTVPAPNIVINKVPGSRRSAEDEQGGTWRTARRNASSGTPVAKLSHPEPEDGPKQTEIHLDPSLDDGHVDMGDSAEESKHNTEDVPAAPVEAKPAPEPEATPAPAPSTSGKKSAWRPSKQLEAARNADSSNP